MIFDVPFVIFFPKSSKIINPSVNSERIHNWFCVVQCSVQYVQCQLCEVKEKIMRIIIIKIYVATDSSPVDMQSYELCCDMIDVVIDVSCIYGIG